MFYFYALLNEDVPTITVAAPAASVTVSASNLFYAPVAISATCSAIAGLTITIGDSGGQNTTIIIGPPGT